MASVARILRRPIQVISGQGLSQCRSTVPMRFFSAQPSLKGDEFLKNIFFEVKSKFEAALGVLRKEKITIDPDDPKAVSHYAQVMKAVREKAQLFSESERINNTIRDFTQGIPDARSYLEKLQEIRIKSGITDDLGAEKMMMDALEKLEKELKKPLMRSDKKGMALLQAEFDLINKKLGIRKEDLPKYEQELELDIAKAQLEEIKKDAEEAIETHKKREGAKGEDLVVDVKSLDMRNFL
eukprot:Gb_28183 [translate_table: standard]